jgi:hypothetical protein
MFEVTNVQRGLLAKRVELTALDDMSGTDTLVNPAPHGIAAHKCPYHFPRGSNLTLAFVPWKALSIGNRVDLSTVLKHPSVQRQLFRDARS